MEIDKIIEELKYYTGELPKEALRQALEHKEEITPKLLEMLEYTKENLEKIYNEEDEFFGYTYAIFLLAEFREQKLFPFLIDLLNKDERIVEYILGDDYTEHLARILASVYDGDDEALFSIIENKKIDEFIRSTVLQTFSILYLHGVKDREFIVNYFRKLLNEKEDNDNSYLYEEIFTETNDLRLIELEDIIDKSFIGDIGEEEIEELKERFKDENYKINRYIFPFNPLYEYIHDTIDIMDEWDCFSYKEDEEFELSFNYRKCIYAIDKRKNKQNDSNIKLGRNEPCYCGSGIKYKKCCLNKNDNVNEQELEDLEFIDRSVSKAYWYLEREQYKKAYNYFRRSWFFVQEICKNNSIKSIDEYDIKYQGYGFLSNWIQEYVDILQYNIDSKSSIYEILSLCDYIQNIFDLNVESEIYWKQYFTRLRANCNFRLDEEEIAKEIIENYLKENPNWVWGYVEMADWYNDQNNLKYYNLQKAKDILLRTEKLGDIEDIDAIYERLEDIYDQLGDKEKAKEYNKKWENAVG